MNDHFTNASPAGDKSRAEDQDRADMARLLAGHDIALNDLMTRHGQKLFHYLVRCLQNEDDAAEVAQETFVRVYQNRMKFDAHRNFPAWLFTIATNLVKDRYRRRSRHPEVSLDAQSQATGDEFGDNLPEHGPGPSESLQGKERAEAVQRAVGQLPEELRVPLILSEYEELSHAEIGEILGCSSKAVETRIYRARQQLRLSLNKFFA